MCANPSTYVRTYMYMYMCMYMYMYMWCYQQVVSERASIEHDHCRCYHHRRQRRQQRLRDVPAGLAAAEIWPGELLPADLTDPGF